MIVRDILLRDVGTMTRWGTFEDPRYAHFNFPYHTPEEFELWYRYKVRGFRVRTYGAFLDENLIGFVTFKKINRILGRAELGVIFDPNHVGEGYGKAAITECMERIGLRKVYLFVSSFNDRARHVYEQLGFTFVETVYRPFESQEIGETEWMDGENFVRLGDVIYGKYAKMEIYVTKPLSK